jgi:hypothetical protein
MKRVGRLGYWLALACATLVAGCSNGTGSVADRPAATSTTPPPAPAPPAAAPAPTPTPTPTPPPTPAPTPPPPQPIGSSLAGFWEGRAVEGGEDGESKRTIAFIDQLGQMQLIVGSDANPELVLHGNICCEAAVSESVTGLRFERTSTEDVKLEIGLSGGRLVGDFDFRGRHRFDLAPSPTYAQPLTLQSLAGVYTHTDSFFGISSTLTLSINSNGEITGAHSNGCIYGGTVSIPDTSRNMARLNVQLSGCGNRLTSSTRWNGHYQGLALRRGNTLYQSLVGPTWFGPQSLDR